MTVCRAVARLSDAGFIQENAAERGHGSSVHISDNLKFIIADIMGDEYSIHLLSSDYKTLRHFSYPYNYSLDVQDNLTIFFERAKSLFSEKANHFSGIAVICNDKSRADSVQKAIDLCFGEAFTVILDVADAIQGLTASAIDARFPSASAYYLHLGHNNFAYYVTDKFAIRSNPQILMDEGGKILGERIRACISPEQLHGIIFNIVNAASAILDAKLYIIESDRFILGNGIGKSIAEKLGFGFSDGRRLLISDVKPKLYIKGAAVALQTEIIRKILSKQ